MAVLFFIFKFRLSRFWRDDHLFKRTFAANFADVHGLTKKNSREFAKSVATVLFFCIFSIFRG